MLDRSPAPTFSLRRAYLALVVMGGIGTHLIAEFAAMGMAAGRITFSNLHIYLAVAFAAAAFIIVHDLRALVLTASSGRDAKRLAELGLTALPFAGRSGFCAATAALQLAVGWATVVAERSPLFSHDTVAGAAGALLTAAVLSFLVRMLGRRLPGVAAAIIEFRASALRRAPRWSVVESPDETISNDGTWCLHLFNRPPPFLQSA